MNPLKFSCKVSERGTENLGTESIGKALVKLGSKFEVSDSDSTLGLKGGVTCFLESSFQSMPSKKGCSLSSSASLELLPNLF